jgi:hypothetical protein
MRDMLTVGLHERTSAPCGRSRWYSAGTDGPRREQDEVPCSVREAQGDTNLPAKGRHLYQVEAELKLLVLRLFVSLIYRPITNPANRHMLTP